MEPFSVVELSEANKMQKMLKVLPSENALKELNNTLSVKSFNEISFRDIDLINKKYKINLTSKFRVEIQNLFRNFVSYHLNQNLPNDGSRFIPKLADILRIKKKKVSEILVDVGTTIFRTRFQTAVKNRRLSEEDSIFLAKLWMDLGISEDTAQKIAGEVRWKAIESYVDPIIADGEISPEQDKELQESVISLTGDVNTINSLNQYLDKLRKAWQLNHGELPILIPDIILHKNEVCHLSQTVDLYEYRKIGGTIGYAGPTLRIKIVKGLYYRAGKLGYSTQTKESWVKIDSGKVYLTNKRIVFAGRTTNTSIRYSNIINIQPYIDGVDIIKDRGKNSFLAFSSNIHDFAAILTRLIINA